MSDSWSTGWYNSLMQSLRTIAGDGPVDTTTGVTLPNLSAVDTIAMLGVVTPALVSAIGKFVLNVEDAQPSRTAIQSQYVDSEGVLNQDSVTAAEAQNAVRPEDIANSPDPSEAATESPVVGGLSMYVDAKTYLQAQPSDLLGNAVAWERFVDPINSYTVWQTGRNAPYFQMLRQAIADYQIMVNAVTAALQQNASNTTAPAGADNLSELFRGLRALDSDMDSLNEPPALGSISEALRYALAQTSEWVGKAAAEVANEVGKNAGIIGANLTGGFLENAGFLSFVVVGLVFHLYLR